MLFLGEISKLPQKWQYLNVTDPPKSWNLNKVDWLGVSDTLTVDHAAKYDARIKEDTLPLCMWLDTPEASCSGQIRTELLWVKGSRPPAVIEHYSLWRTSHWSKKHFKYFQPIFGWCVIMLTWHLQNTNPVHLQTRWGHVDPKLRGPARPLKNGKLSTLLKFHNKSYPERKRFGKSSLNIIFRH